MRSLLLLINKYFWRGITGPIFAFVVPLILTMFIGRIIGPSFIVPGVFMIPILCIMLVFMPQSLFEFKNSSLLKRIGTTPIKPSKFLFSIAIYNMIITLFACLFLFGACFAVFFDCLHAKKSEEQGVLISTPGFLTIITKGDWIGFIYSCTVLVVTAALMGLLLASIAKSTLFIQATGISFMLVSLFVGPCILPISLVGSVDVVRYLGYLVPFKYSISTAIESLTANNPGTIVNAYGSSMWDINTPYVVLNVMSIGGGGNDDLKPIEIFNSTDKIINIVMPYVYMIIFLYLVSATFNWQNRGKVKFRWNVWIELIVSASKKVRNQQVFDGDLNSPYILEVDHLTKKFRKGKSELVANNDISFKIKRGRNLAILGANGAGKTVLTEMLVGINKPNSGKIRYNYEYKKSFQEKVGIQFQDSQYPFGIRVKDVVKFFIFAYHLKISKTELSSLVDQFGITSFYDKNASSLSGGQQQRLNLLLSIIHKPKIAFLDELSTGLDIKIRTEIKKFIKEYAKANDMTIVIVSHDMNEVDYLCEDIIVINQGRLVDKQSKESIYKKYDSLEDYIDQFLSNKSEKTNKTSLNPHKLGKKQTFKFKRMIP